MSEGLSIAAILPRFGASLGGGAETLVKGILEQCIRPEVQDRYGVSHVEVWTTCARDHRTWANELPAGRTIEGGIPVLRFPVDERNLEIFIRCEMALQDGRQLSLDEQLDWMEQSVNSRALYEHIAAHSKKFSCLLLAPYLFGTSFWGSLISPERTVLIPCLHDEPYAYQSIFRAVFSKVRGLFFNARPEMKLAEGLYALPDFERKSSVVGMGFDAPKSVAGEEGASDVVRNFLRERKPFVLYSGRKEQGKNLHVLIEAMEYYQRRYQNDLRLVVIGAGTIDFLKELPPWMRDLGFVSEDEKLLLMSQALCLCQPSRNESFSIVIMEAWQQRCPVVVHAYCDVTRFHVLESGGGLYFANCAEFAAVIETLRCDPDLARSLGNAGAEYVAREYSWEAVMERFFSGLQQLGLADSNAARTLPVVTAS